jgi:hypothetical protein
MQVVGMEGSVVASAAWREMFHDRRNSDRCDSGKQENTHMNKVGGGRLFTAHSLPYIKSILGQQAFLWILEP